MSCQADYNLLHLKFDGNFDLSLAKVINQLEGTPCTTSSEDLLIWQQFYEGFAVVKSSEASGEDSRHGRQMAIARFLDFMCLALRA